MLSYYAHWSIFNVSRNLSSLDAHPNTIITPSFPLFDMKDVDKHPPAFTVCPVLTPTTFEFSNNLFVFVQ